MSFELTSYLRVCLQFVGIAVVAGCLQYLVCNLCYRFHSVIKSFSLLFGLGYFMRRIFLTMSSALLLTGVVSTTSTQLILYECIFLIPCFLPYMVTVYAQKHYLKTKNQ